MSKTNYFYKFPNIIQNCTSAHYIMYCHQCIKISDDDRHFSISVPTSPNL